VGKVIWRRLCVIAAIVGFGAVAASGTGYAGVADASAIVVPYGSAGLQPQPKATVTDPGTHAAATTSLPRQLVVPDVLAVIQSGIPAADLPKIKKLSGVRAVLSVSGGAIEINGKQVNVIGVSPGQFRSWTSPATAGEQALWQALSRGRFITSTAAQRTLGVVKGHSYPAVAAHRTTLMFGGSAGLSVPGVDAVVDNTVAARLGLVSNLGVLINAPADNLASLVQKVRQITGTGSHVISLQPTTTSTASKLPVDTRVSTARPTTYMQLYQASAARYCPGLSWTVLAAIGEVESGDGTNVGPSSAGALGPMQFLPSTWKQDGIGDTGAPNIMNPYDAVPSAAEYLCAAGGAKGGQSLYNAIYAYNHASWYVDEVLAIAREYAQSAS
jgi:hypothetical protein